MVRLRACTATPKVKVLREPLILISKQAAYDMMFYVEHSPDEVGWLGSVARSGWTFLIEKIYLPGQDVHATTTEMTEADQDVLYRYVIDQYGDDEYNKLRFWGHSHVNMGVMPSGQDDKQVGDFAEAVTDFYIRGILNKKGEARFDLYCFEDGLEVQDATYAIAEDRDPARDEELAAILKEAVRKKEIVTGVGPGYPYCGPGGYQDGGVWYPGRQTETQLGALTSSPEWNTAWAEYRAAKKTESAPSSNYQHGLEWSGD